MDDSGPIPQSSHPDSLTGKTLGLATSFVLLWNSGFIAAEAGLYAAGVLTFLLWRYAALALILLGVVALRRRPLWPGLHVAAQQGFVGITAHGVWLGCVLYSLRHGVPVGIIALIVAVQPLVTGALSGAVVGERTDARQWLGLALGFIGIGVVVGVRLDTAGGAPFAGYVFPFGSVAGITAASLLQRRRAQVAVQLPLDVALLWQSAGVVAALALPAALVEGLKTEWTPRFAALLAWLVIAVSLGAYATMWKLLEDVDATRVASLFFLNPPVTMVMAWVAFGDEPQASDLIGMGVVAIGVALVQCHPGKCCQMIGGYPSFCAFARVAPILPVTVTRASTTSQPDGRGKAGPQRPCEDGHGSVPPPSREMTSISAPRRDFSIESSAPTSGGVFRGGCDGQCCATSAAYQAR